MDEVKGRRWRLEQLLNKQKRKKLCKVIKVIDDVLAVGADTFVFSPNRFVIEFHHDGEIIIGFENQTLF